MTLFELQEWLGHSTPTATQHYAKITPLKIAKSYADAGYFARNLRAIEVLVDQDVVHQQSAEEVLLSVMDGVEDDKLPAFALRLALTGHVDIPREGETDHLIEGEKLFAPGQPKTAAKQRTTKALKKPANAKAKSAKKRSSKRVAA